LVLIYLINFHRYMLSDINDNRPLDFIRHPSLNTTVNVIEGLVSNPGSC